MHKLIKVIREETVKLARNLKNDKSVKELKFYEIIHGMLVDNVKKTKREIFYASPNIFKRQETVNKMIDKFAHVHKVRLIDFNVSASLKGLFYGEVTFIESNKAYTLYQNLIPDMNEVTDITCRFSSVLVVEKDCMMTFIKEVFLRNNRPIDFLLVTGKGYPDYNTLAFLRRLEHMKCQIYGLFDLDPFGLSIFKNYKSKINSMVRIGITSKDVFEYKIMKNELITLTQRDYKLLTSLKNNVIDSEFSEDISFLEGLGQKMEIEIFTSYQTIFIVQYLEKKLMINSLSNIKPD
ncbi:Catalytic subunit of the meiotic double strand break transesterase [Trachipleistophora hominis]|uniref:DNA topoisomerase (ATP-hydrolyzing) n=1 Tax=Trachipleistophora hominis TaxID=72359 RepID=L7JUK4_TRAHO|nr:Catalytic subunit of the meiotic double strand break transesterase [Trachipleistophora hominis]